MSYTCNMYKTDGDIDFRFPQGWDNLRNRKIGLRPPLVAEGSVIPGAIELPEYDIFQDEKSYSRRDAHLNSLDEFIRNNKTVAGLNTADFRDLLSAIAAIESSYRSGAENRSGYSGYYGLKGGKNYSESEQHRKAYEHLASLFKNVITDDDLEKARRRGFSDAQTLYKIWNQQNNAIEYLQNGTDRVIGNNPRMSVMGNNIPIEIDLGPYVSEADTSDYHVIVPGDNFSTIQSKVRKPGRHYNQAGKDMRKWNSDDVVNGKLHIGDTIWFSDKNGPHDTIDEDVPVAPVLIFNSETGDAFPINTVSDSNNLLLKDYRSGGTIHIKPSKRGTFTAAAKKHGKSVQAFASQVLAHKENYSPAMVKKANFARNAAKWHAEGGLMGRLDAYSGGDRQKVLDLIQKVRGA